MILRGAVLGVVEAKGSHVDESNLEAAVVVVYYKQSGKRLDRGIALKNPRLVTLSGRVYLSGIAFRRDPWWNVGRQFYVALDEVHSFYSFDSEESHDEAWKLVPRRSVLRRFFGEATCGNRTPACM